MSAGLLRISDEVRGALERGEPVVALESTVIAHGLPFPRNLEVAGSLERAVREGGAVPATIGMVAGRIIVGLDPGQIERLGTGSDVSKASERDLGPLAAAGADAATTVAGTARIAARCGISVFATGGIGGVHPGGERSLDISADLDALARTPVAVVCAGAKAILDLPRTLEALETRGVAILGFATDELPAFYQASSGLAIPHRVDDVASAARAVEAHWGLGSESGVLVCVPPPVADALPAREVEGWIARAEREAERAGVDGPALTPWLLDRLAELSGGRTVEANVALLRNNARTAAGIARALRG